DLWLSGSAYCSHCRIKSMEGGLHTFYGGPKTNDPGSEGVGTKNETRPLSPVASGSPLSLGGVLGDIAINVSWPWLESKSRRAVALRECDSIPAALVLQHLMGQIPLEQPSMY